MTDTKSDRASAPRTPARTSSGNPEHIAGLAHCNSINSDSASILAPRTPHLRRRHVQPLGIIHAHKPGRSSATSDNRPSTASPTKNRPGIAPALNPNVVANASPLRTGKTVHTVEQRPAQLMQRRERQLHLRLHPDRTQHPHIRCRPDRVRRSAVFPIPASPAQDQHPAPSRPAALEQPIEDDALISPTAQHQPPRSWMTASHQNGHPKAKPSSRESGTEQKAAA